MKFTFLILALFLSTGSTQPKNKLDSFKQRPNAKTEQRILKKFKESDCYTRGDNPKNQPHDNYRIQVVYSFNLKKLDEDVFANELLFLKNLRESKNRSPLYYLIYNDSLKPAVAFFRKDLKYCYSHYLDEVFLYAMKNQYLLFYVWDFLLGIQFGYKDGRLVVFRRVDGILTITPFEEFDWDQYLRWENYQRTGVSKN
jgi:hypothetical protein